MCDITSYIWWGVTSNLWQAENFRSCLSESTAISQEENRAEDHHVLGMVTPYSFTQFSPESDTNEVRAQRHEGFPLHILGHKQGTRVNPVASSLQLLLKPESCYFAFYLFSQLKILRHQNWTAILTNMNHSPASEVIFYCLWLALCNPFGRMFGGWTGYSGFPKWMLQSKCPTCPILLATLLLCSSWCLECISKFSTLLPFWVYSRCARSQSSEVIRQVRNH